MGNSTHALSSRVKAKNIHSGKNTAGASRSLESLSNTLGNLTIQHQLHPSRKPSRAISNPYDPEEQHARQLATRVTQMHRPLGNNDSLTPPRTSSMGQALPMEVRRYFEPRFQRDFSQVEIRTGSAANDEAMSLNAKAFTQGNTITFARDQFNPHTHQGRYLIAHELAHIAQGAEGHADPGKIYRETWDIDDTNRTIERGFLVQLNFENTWGDWWDNTGWTTARKNTFRAEFERVIEDTFNNSSTAIYPPASALDVLPQINIDEGYKPLVDIRLVPDGEWSVAEDWEVDVSSNPNSEHRTSSSNRHYGTLDEADNDPVTKASSAPGVTQIATVHEFGHFIGLDHPGEGLEGGWFSDSQLSPNASEYGHTGTDQHGRAVDGPNDLMGGGMGLRHFYFDEWAAALTRHIADLRRAAQQAQFDRDWRMFQRALNNDPAGVEWFMRGMGGL